MPSFRLQDYKGSSHYSNMRNACIRSLDTTISPSVLAQAEKSATDFRKQYGNRLLSAEKTIISTQDYKL
jgi:hypothetical protein